MNSFELNKILGAILGTCLILLALNIGAGAIFAPREAGQAGLQHRGQGKGDGEKAGAAKEPEQPIETLLAKASVEKGQSAAKQCQACHTFEKGGPNRVGPNLWNIVGPRAGSPRGLQLFRGDEGQGRQMDLRRTQQIPRQSAQLYPRHRHDLRRLTRGSSAPTSSTILHTLSDNPCAAAQGGGRPAPAGGEPAKK